MVPQRLPLALIVFSLVKRGRREAKERLVAPKTRAPALPTPESLILTLSGNNRSHRRCHGKEKPAHATCMRRLMRKGRLLSSATYRLERYRIGGSLGTLCHLDYRRGVRFVSIHMNHGRVRAGCGIEDAVVIEIPGIPDVSLRRRQGGRQGHVDVIAALAGLTLNARGQSHSVDGGASVWRYQCHQD